MSQRARIGWSTHGHSAVDVNIYSSGGKAAEAIHGNVENTDVGKFLASYLDVDVEAITKELEEKLVVSSVEVTKGAADEVAEEGMGARHTVEWALDAGL